MQNVTLHAILELVLYRLKWLLLGLVCGALVFSAYTVLFVEDAYTASISLYVQDTEDETGSGTQTSLYASRMLTNSCAVILQDAETVKMAAENMTVPASLSQISQALSVTASKDSAIITIQAVTGDAVLSQSICQAMCDVAPEMLYDIVGNGVVSALGDVPPAEKTGPDIVRNALVGSALGFILAAAIVFVIHLTDTTVKHKEDVRRMTDLPVLGEIPTLTM